jgi:hypothetical protein
MLTKHGFKLLRAGFRNSLATDPAADEMDEGIDPTEFVGDSLRRGMDRFSISQVSYQSEESIIGQIQFADEGIQFILISTN